MNYTVEMSLGAMIYMKMKDDLRFDFILFYFIIVIKIGMWENMNLIIMQFSSTPISLLFIAIIVTSDIILGSAVKRLYFIQT
jgi:hypothetical protein